VPAFVSVIAVKRSVKAVVMKLPSRFVVLVVGEIMQFNRKSELKYKNFNSFHWCHFPQCLVRLTLVSVLVLMFLFFFAEFPVVISSLSGFKNVRQEVRRGSDI